MCELIDELGPNHNPVRCFEFRLRAELDTVEKHEKLQENLWKEFDGWPTAGDPKIHDLRRLFEEELHEEIVLEAEEWDEIWNCM